MALSQVSGPLVVGAGHSVDTQQAAPSPVNQGVALFDPRFPYRYGAGAENNAIMAIGAALGGQYLTVDAVPSTISAVNIAAAANPSTGVAMTLVNGAGAAGVTKLSAALTIAQTGNVVPTGALVIDGTPGLVTFGTQGSIAIADPTKCLNRAISITGVAGGTGGTVKIVGYDLYGNLIHETLTVTSGATTTVSHKAYKFVASVTPQFTDSHTLSVGCSDSYGFPLRADTFGYVTIFWDATVVTSSTGFTGAVSTAATATSSDVRGLYALQSDASDGTKRLTITQRVSVANISSTTGLFGVAQFTA